MAAGLSLEADRLPEFRRKLSRTIEKMLGESQLEEAVLEIDGWLALDEANLALAEQLESLAPFGPGNEKLTLASHNLTVKSSAKLGKNKEHLKLTVEDENGAAQQVLWWDGGSEELPEGKFVLAYTLRASDWRGVRQAQLEFIDFQVAESEKIEVRSKKVEVVDYRKDERGKNLLSTFIFPFALWAEGAEKKNVNGLDRNELKPADTLVIWTIPPSPEELKAALKIVNPEKIILFAVDSGTDDLKAFLERLAGLTKFVIHQKAGKTSLAELAAATAQKVTAVSLGLKWLSKRGQVTVESPTEAELILRAGGISNEKAAEAAASHLSSILRETAAYREHFKRADFRIEDMDTQ